MSAKSDVDSVSKKKNQNSLKNGYYKNDIAIQRND